MEVWIFAAYLLVAAAVVICSIKCADYVDLLDKKTRISGAFIGGVILAAVTSLPELVTSISSVTVVQNPGLVIGNVLGSNIFNLCIFGGLVVCTLRRFSRSRVAKSHLATLICTAAAFIGCGFAIFTGFGNIPVVNINVISVLILVVYIISLRYLSAEESGETEASESPLTVKQIIWRFSLTAIGLVGASILITVLTDRIAAMLSLEASLAGALFLGIATSLPELTSSIALVRKGNYNAMIGNVVGSNMFNFTILSVCDLLSRGENLYVGSAQTVSMLVFGVISTLLVGVVLFCKQRQGKSLPKRARFAMYALPALLTLVSYLSFLMVSM